MVSASKLKIAVVGAGISGISAAFLLSKSHEVTLFEKNPVLGGHTNTRVIHSGDDKGLSIDTGFIVCNPKNYPNFYRFIASLGVALQDSDMSFGFSSENSGLQYLGPALKDFLLIPQNLLRLDFLRMIFEQFRFNKRVLKDLASGVLKDIRLGDYLKELGVSAYFEQNYLTPLIAAIWSSPDTHVLDFPAQTFAIFFNNHGMLEFNKRPQWQTVCGGSHSYLRAFEKQFSGKIVCNAAIASIQRSADAATLLMQEGQKLSFDKLVLATHADEALALLETPTSQEAALLGTWRYSKNEAVLHTDTRVVPPNPKHWASWNYHRDNLSNRSAPVSITYYMNRLQNLKTKNNYFVTLNRTKFIDPNKIIYQTTYTHPIYTPQSVSSQEGLRAINGTLNTFYCGAYMRYGFHEDGITSALEVAKHFDLRL